MNNNDNSTKIKGYGSGRASNAITSTHCTAKTTKQLNNMPGIPKIIIELNRENIILFGN